MAPRAFGPYEVLARLAAGGAANIFLARQPGVAGFHKLVCLKALLPERSQDQEFVAMFLDEARLAARLNHPHCVKIFDLGRVRGTYFISMEFIFGETLWGLLSTVADLRVPLPSEAVAYVLAAAAEGLHHAHELTDPKGKPYNLVHRDVSPQNIMITYDGQVKVLDFGIAKAETGRQATATGIVKGKFSYMSPEQITGATIDRRSDVYSLGIVMFECLASRRLYRAETPEEIARMMLEKRPPRLKDVVPDIPAELDLICLKALARHPGNRYSTAKEMADALRRHLNSLRRDDHKAALVRLVEERFVDRIGARRRIYEQALAGKYEEAELLETLGARVVMDVDLFPEEGVDFGPDETLLEGNDFSGDEETYQPDLTPSALPLNHDPGQRVQVVAGPRKLEDDDEGATLDAASKLDPADPFENDETAGEGDFFETPDRTSMDVPTGDAENDGLTGDAGGSTSEGPAAPGSFEGEHSLGAGPTAPMAADAAEPGDQGTTEFSPKNAVVRQVTDFPAMAPERRAPSLLGGGPPAGFVGERTGEANTEEEIRVAAMLPQLDPVDAFGEAGMFALPAARLVPSKPNQPRPSEPAPDMVGKPVPSIRGPSLGPQGRKVSGVQPPLPRAALPQLVPAEGYSEVGSGPGRAAAAHEARSRDHALGLGQPVSVPHGNGGPRPSLSGFVSAPDSAPAPTPSIDLPRPEIRADAGTSPVGAKDSRYSLGVVIAALVFGMALGLLIGVALMVYL
jgi:hypothetical protein